MKNILVLLLLMLPACVFSQTTWHAETYRVSFKIKNAGFTVSGKFSGLRSELKFSPDKLGSSHLQGSVEVATISTGIGKRDEDLQHEKYFNTNKYKLIDVTSTKLYKKGDRYAGMFQVTIKGVTKEMEIPFEFIQANGTATFKGTFTVNRRDFGVGGNSLIMSDDAVVTILITAKG